MLCSTQNLLTDMLDKVGDLRSVHDPLCSPTVHKGDPSTHTCTVVQSNPFCYNYSTYRSLWTNNREIKWVSLVDFRVISLSILFTIKRSTKFNLFCMGVKPGLSH